MSKRKSEASVFYNRLGLFLLGAIVVLPLLAVAFIIFLWRVFLRPAYNFIVNTGQDAADWMMKRYNASDE